MFNFFQKKAFGIDLSDLSVKVARLHNGKSGFSLLNFSRQDIPDGIIEQGEIRKPDELSVIIREAVSGAKGPAIRTRNCIASLPEIDSFVQIIQLPKMKESEVREAIKWETESHIPLSINDVYFDWQIIEPLKESKDHMDILVGALSKKLVDPYLDVFKKAGLRPLIFEIESIATVRALIKEGFTAEPVLVVDFGAKRTSFIIYSGRAVQFTASSAISNYSLIEDIAKSLDISKEKAKAFKIQYGLERDKNEDVFKVLEPRLKELAGEIKKYIEFYYTHGLPGHFNSPVISRILLCGGGANLAGICSFLSEELGVGVEIGNPWVNILKGSLEELPELPFEQSIGYATVLGLALRGVNLNE